ncbi:MAG: hypothetical protein II073_05840 [Lachnospiraceae bacterium]|nr:hypothetical protein [Lachnospiraceae bacterium]
MMHYNEAVTTGEWIITFLLTCFSWINLFFLFIWAFGKGMKTSKKNWARAVMILWLIGIPALLIIIVMFGLSLGVNS